MQRAHLVTGASLQTLPSSSFSFGTGDFTLMGMVDSQQGGTLVARKGTAGGTGNGGFLLVVNPDSSVKFATDDGFGYFQVVTAATGILDGGCHTVAGIRSGAELSIVIDGIVIAATASGGGTSPLNVDNTLPLTIGCTQQSQEPNNQLLGDVMNVSVWNAALSGDLLVKAAFARIAGDEPGLQGYWTLDATTNDLSQNNNPANMVGAVTFAYCLDCVWAQASNNYAFCQIANMPDANAPATHITLSQEMAVAAGTPALAMAVMADQDVPAFPTGAQITVSDPTGQIYNQNQNTDTVFAVTSAGQLWSLMVVNPAAGVWRVTVTAPANTAFQLNLQTVPTAAVVETSRQALDPLFGTPSAQGRKLALSFGGFWGIVAAVAVAAVVGVIVAAAAVAIFPGNVPIAIGVGLGAFCVVGQLALSAALPVVDSGSLHNATGQVAGMAGFIVAADKFLMFDGDPEYATAIIQYWRSQLLYPQVTASSFNEVQSLLRGINVTRANVKAALTAFSSGYVTGNGHGRPSYVCGWWAGKPSGPLEEVLSTSGPGQFSAAEVKGKIIHLFACNCGDPAGLGQAMVAAGALAFFGYNTEFIIPANSDRVKQLELQRRFCACDIQIDLAMINGATCDAAYTQAIALYNTTIATLQNEGYSTDTITALQNDRDALVSPSTNPMYGNKNAQLKIN
jgi:hypothetical protein